MKKLLIIIILIINTSRAFSEYYDVCVNRVETNLYKDIYSGIYIVTNLCLELAILDDALLVYDAYSYDNKLIFSDDSVCDVKKILK